MVSSDYLKSTCRIFIAIKPDFNTIILNAYKKLRQKLSESSINWVKEENLHITLAFLGDISTGILPLLEALLIKLTVKNDSFQLTFRNFGSFGKPAPKVIWIGIDENFQLNTIQRQLNKYLNEINFEFDSKPFVPHLTLGRVKSISDINEFRNFSKEYSNQLLHTSNIDTIVLYESLLKPEGPHYKIVNTFRFGRD